MKKKKRLSADERKKQIVDASIRVFSKKGFQGTKTIEIAKAAGISEATIFKHFKNKDDLYKQIINRQMKIHSEELHALYAQIKNIKELLKALTVRAIEDVEKDPNFMRLMLYSSLEDRSFAVKFAEESFFVKIEEFTAIIKKGIKSGEFRNVNPELAVQSFSNMVAGYCISQFVLKQTEIESTDIKDVVETFVDIFLNGIRNQK